jgi:predicted PurR-regulated permease PerM
MKTTIVILSILLIASIVINVMMVVLCTNMIKKASYLIKRVEHYRELISMAQNYINKKSKNDETKYKRISDGDNV